MTDFLNTIEIGRIFWYNKTVRNKWGGMVLERLIFHIDVNSAFLSWEAVKRVKEGLPDLRLVPSAVGGDRDKRTGVILAKSVPAKKYGVKTGEPVAMALRKCPNLVLAKPDFKLYARSSAAFVKILEKYAPVVEKYSIDECFLDMSGTERIYPDPIALAYRIKDEIRDILGFTVNVGIGENKLLAKMASDFEKPDRVHTLFTSEIAEKMHPLPVGELFSVGASTSERLTSRGIRTIGDLARCDLTVVTAILGNKHGSLLHRYANGIDDSPVLEAPEEAKGYSVSTTLEEDVTSYEAADSVLLALSDSVASRMRSDGVSAYCIAVSIRSADFVNRSHQKKLSVSTDITDEIYRTVTALLRELWNGKTPLRLLGVALSDIDRGDAEQLSFFGDNESRERMRKLDRTVDEIRKKFGTDTIKLGGVTREVGKKYRAAAELENENNLGGRHNDRI